MKKKAASQWDFGGELFPTEATRRVLSVTELTASIRRILERELRSVWVTGEVTNLRLQTSGHVYFTLKDLGSQLSCVLFRGEAVHHREFLKDGQKLSVQGDLTVYEPRGQYQLVVREVELQGVGALQIAFEQLKRKLQAEGLFATERKRPLPRFPQRIGLVTSPTGAAIRDVLHVIERRHRALEIVLVPCRVQGDGAAAEIAAAIRLLNRWHASAAKGCGLDLILITRGGGSLEDLWAFNEESVARAIFESQLPIVSAVGHEIDFTISDFVADLRAATPSAAAELITEGPFASRQVLNDVTRRLRQLVRHQLDRDRDDLRELAGRLGRVHPRRVLQDRLQLVDDLQESLFRATRQNWRQLAITATNLQQRLHRLKPSVLVAQKRQALRECRRRFQERLRQEVQRRRVTLATLAARLILLGPDNVLARGYSITLNAATGQVLRDPAEARPGESLITKLKAGSVRSIVETPVPSASRRS